MNTRVGCYGAVVESDRILLAHWAAAGRWTLPGGGMEDGESPEKTVVREVAEETGLAVVVEKLLGAFAVYVVVNDAGQRVGPRRELRLVYRGRVVGGALTDEVGGSTDRVAWFDLEDVAEVPRTSLVDEALELYRAGSRQGPADPVRTARRAQRRPGV